MDLDRDTAGGYVGDVLIMEGAAVWQHRVSGRLIVATGRRWDRRARNDCHHANRSPRYGAGWGIRPAPSLLPYRGTDEQETGPVARVDGTEGTERVEPPSAGVTYGTRQSLPTDEEHER
jgi:hypothetical protein